MYAASALPLFTYFGGTQFCHLSPFQQKTKTVLSPVSMALARNICAAICADIDCISMDILVENG